jgi:K+-sensing histidine kinase KdpD
MARLRMSRLIRSRWSGLLAAVTMIAALSGLGALLQPLVPMRSILMLYVLAVMAVAIVWGTWLAVVTAILSAAVFSYFFAPPDPSFRIDEPSDVVALVAFLATALVVGQLAVRLQRAATESVRPFGGAVRAEADRDTGCTVDSTTGGLRSGYPGGRSAVPR